MTRNLDTVLVTGGAGFTGTHLIDKLVKRGHEVTALDNLSTDNLENIRAHLNRGGFRFVARANKWKKLACESSVAGVPLDY